MRIVLSPQAGDDLREIHEFIREDNPGAADTVVGRIVEVVGLLAAHSFEGSAVRLKDGRLVRTWAVPPYRLYYRRLADEFQVVRIYHQARRPIERGR